MNFYNSNHYDVARNNLSNKTSNEALNKKLDNLFTPKSYFQRWRHFNVGAITLSYICNFLSSVTAFSVLSFVLFDSFGGVFPSAVALILSASVALLAVGVLETMKRFSTANFLRRIFQEKQTSTMLLTLVLFCCGCSVLTSFYGAKMIPNITEQQPIEIEATSTNTDSIKQFYAGLIATKQQTINEYLPSIKSSGTARKTVAKLEGETTSLHSRMEEALQQATRKDSTNQANVAAINQQAIIDFEATKENKGSLLGWIALSFELVFLLCLIFNWSFYWNCYTERASVGAKKTHRPVTQQQPEQRPTNEGDHQRPTIVQGFLHGLQQQQKEASTDAVITDAVKDKALKFTRRCDHCSTPFMHKVHNQRFCSEKCRIKAWEKRTGKALKLKQKSEKTAKC